MEGFYLQRHKPEHPTADEMLRRINELGEDSEWREPEESAVGGSQGCSAPGLQKEVPPNEGIKPRLGVLWNDINGYLDFCLARFIVWRESRRHKKETKDSKASED